MLRLDQWPAMEFPSVNEFDKVIALGTAFKVYHQVIRSVTGMFFECALHGVYAPRHPAVCDGVHTINASIEVQDGFGSAGAYSKINQYIAAESLPQWFDNRCRQDGVAEAPDADNQNAVR
jgi:hypothetical protein